MLVQSSEIGRPVDPRRQSWISAKSLAGGCSTLLCFTASALRAPGPALRCCLQEVVRSRIADEIVVAGSFEGTCGVSLRKFRSRSNCDYESPCSGEADSAWLISTHAPRDLAHDLHLDASRPK